MVTKTPAKVQNTLTCVQQYIYLSTVSGCVNTRQKSSGKQKGTSSFNVSNSYVSQISVTNYKKQKIFLTKLNYVVSSYVFLSQFKHVSYLQTCISAIDSKRNQLISSSVCCFYARCKLTAQSHSATQCQGRYSAFQIEAQDRFLFKCFLLNAVFKMML